MDAHCRAALRARSWRDMQACELDGTLEVALVALLLALGVAFCGARALYRCVRRRRATREPTEPDTGIDEFYGDPDDTTELPTRYANTPD